MTAGVITVAGLVGIAIWLANQQPPPASVTQEVALAGPAPAVPQAPQAARPVAPVSAVGTSASALADPYLALRAELALRTAPPPITDVPTPAAPAPPAGEIVRVQRVIDGDTVVLEDGRKVRLVGINTPERGRPLYKEATQALVELVQGQELTMHYDAERIDMYRRSLCYFYVGDRFVNGEIVRQGLAYCYTWKPNVAHVEELRELQREARAEGLGLWALDAPTPAARYVASGRAHRFHRESCRKVRKANVGWAERNAALDAGFNPCRVCDS